LVRWACRAGARYFCPAFAALVGPVQHFFSLTGYFYYFILHDYLPNNLGRQSCCVANILLKVPKREIFDHSDFPDFYTIKSSWVVDLLVKIFTYYLNF
jgi:hypothetical protein